MLPVAKLDLDNIYQITVLLRACSRRLVVSAGGNSASNKEKKA